MESVLPGAMEEPSRPSLVYPARPPQYHGFCWGCCHPASHCCCGWPQCRKEAKEVAAAPPQNKDTFGAEEQAFIGGSCCVHLSVEYAPWAAFGPADSGTSPWVEVTVRDSEGTTMMWRQETGLGSVYQVRENIITTKPGARLDLKVDGMVARVRWCEVFSC